MHILDEIFEYKRAVLAEQSTMASIAELRSKIADSPPVRPFFDSLKSDSGDMTLIAEVKKASPSKGIIRDPFDPAEIARAYERAGAHCLSVLTDERYFQGSTKNLQLSRESVKIPILRKDFTAGEFDIYEARAMGADAILLIVYALDDVELLNFREIAEGLGMGVLVEAHTESEAERALKSGATLVGINNRDLKTFQESMSTAFELIPNISSRAHVVSESSIKTHNDIQELAHCGAKSVLIGTAFCQSPDIESKVREVMGWPLP